MTVKPTVTNALLLTENTAVVVAGETNVFDASVVFVAGASAGNLGKVSAASGPLYYTWMFGDGTSRPRSLARTATHVYPHTCGAYTASVTVDNGLTTNYTAFTVSAACQLTISKLQAKLNFAQTNADYCSFKGTLDLGADYSCDGKTLTLNVGGAQIGFTMDGKGRGISDRHSCRLNYNRRTGLWTVAATLRDGFWRDAWGPLGLRDIDLPKPGAVATMSVVILLDQESFAGEKTLVYTAKQGISGAAK